VWLEFAVMEVKYKIEVVAMKVLVVTEVLVTEVAAVKTQWW
jgi:hypothetical protein